MIMTKDEGKVRVKVDIDKLKVGDTVYVPYFKGYKYPY